MATPASVNQTIYLWQGTDKNGKKTKGEMPGASQALVKAQLRKQGVIATRVKRKPKDLFGPKKQRITPGDIAIFSRQLATMMKAGIPLVQSFEIVGDSLENPSMAERAILTSCSATWWSLANSPARWRPCSTASPPTRKKPRP